METGLRVTMLAWPPRQDAGAQGRWGEQPGVSRQALSAETRGRPLHLCRSESRLDLRLTGLPRMQQPFLIDFPAGGKRGL